ncbi:MAG: hypothetical protein BZ138_06535, partial [Methanosphaera sp. rholeuAM270]
MKKIKARCFQVQSDVHYMAVKTVKRKGRTLSKRTFIFDVPVPPERHSQSVDDYLEDLQCRARALAGLSQQDPFDIRPDDGVMACCLYEDYDSVPEVVDILNVFPKSVEERRHMLAASLKTLARRLPNPEDGLYQVLPESFYGDAPDAPRLFIDIDVLEAFVLATSDIDYNASSQIPVENQLFLRAAQRKGGRLPFAMVPVKLDGEENAYRLIAIEQPDASYRQASLSAPILVGSDFRRGP